MFVVKDPDLFAATIIPQYFDHNKFSSFARQLNFYGFRKMQAKPIRNADFDADTAKHVTFYNEKFKRGRCDLLKEIQRSTRGGGSHSNQDHAREVEGLKKQIAAMETKMTDMNQQMEERLRRLELDMLGRMEQMMIAMQQSQQTQLQIQQQQHQQGVGSRGVSGSSQMNTEGLVPQAWDPLPLDRNKSNGSTPPFGGTPAVVSTDSTGQIPTKVGGPPTLPPHPKQKQLSAQGLPTALTVPPSRLNSLRGISRGISRGLSVESSASAVLLRNSWEDKFFSMLMLGENEQQNQTDIENSAGPISDDAIEAAIANGGTIPGAVKAGTDMNPHHMSPQGSERTLSSVSTTEAI